MGQAQAFQSARVVYINMKKKKKRFREMHREGFNYRQMKYTVIEMYVL